MNLRQIAGQCQLFLFDLDGTLYLGDRLFPFTRDLLDEIRAQGKRAVFITNNSAQSPADYVIRMAGHGIDTAEEDFITSGRITVKYMAENYPDRPLYVCGTASLKREFTEAGLTVTDDLDAVGAVVIGYDKELTFQKVDDVCRLLYTKNLPYIATHPDKICPTAYGNSPDCGAICDMIAAACGKQPIFIGKPTPLMPEYAMYQTGIDRERTVVIGDRLATDILSGIRAGTHTLLVFSGDNRQEDLAASAFKPDFATADCGDLLAALRAVKE